MIKKLVTIIAFLCLVIGTNGCTPFGPKMYNYSFNFDVDTDAKVYGKRDVIVLDYSYGDFKLLGLQASEGDRVAGNGMAAGGMGGGYMPKADFLYVKWKVLATEKVYEDRVDLRNRLSGDINLSQVHFLIDDSQLYVFLVRPRKVSPDRRLIEPNINGLDPGDFRRSIYYDPREYELRVKSQIYPDIK